MDLGIRKTRKSNREKSPLGPYHGSNPHWGRGPGGIISSQRRMGQGRGVGG